MVDNAETFLKVCAWLKDIQKIKTINKSSSSYGLKHIVERYLKATKTGYYVSNGIFIAAAISCGFRYKECDKKNSQNLFFNMSEKSLS